MGSCIFDADFSKKSTLDANLGKDIELVKNHLKSGSYYKYLSRKPHVRSTKSFLRLTKKRVNLHVLITQNLFNEIVCKLASFCAADSKSKLLKCTTMHWNISILIILRSHVCITNAKQTPNFTMKSCSYSGIKWKKVLLFGLGPWKQISYWEVQNLFRNLSMPFFYAARKVTSFWLPIYYIFKAWKGLKLTGDLQLWLRIIDK